MLRRNSTNGGQNVLPTATVLESPSSKHLQADNLRSLGSEIAVEEVPRLKHKRIPNEEYSLSSSVLPTEECSREKLKRHRIDVAGRIRIPDLWGREDRLKEWSDIPAFDRSMVPSGLMLARKALVEECRRTRSHGLQIENLC